MYAQPSGKPFILLTIFIVLVGLILGFSLSGTDLLDARSDANVQLSSAQKIALQELEMRSIEAETEYQRQLAELQLQELTQAQRQLEIECLQAENEYLKQQADLQYQEQTARVESQKKLLNTTFTLVISTAVIGVILIVATLLIRLFQARKFTSKLELEKISKENISKWVTPEYRKIKVMQARQRELEIRMNELQKKAKEQEIVARELSKTIAAWESSNAEGS